MKLLIKIVEVPSQLVSLFRPPNEKYEVEKHY